MVILYSSTSSSTLKFRCLKKFARNVDYILQFQLWMSEMKLFFSFFEFKIISINFRIRIKNYLGRLTVYQKGDDFLILKQW